MTIYKLTYPNGEQRFFDEQDFHEWVDERNLMSATLTVTNEEITYEELRALNGDYPEPDDGP